MKKFLELRSVDERAIRIRKEDVKGYREYEYKEYEPYNPQTFNPNDIEEPIKVTKVVEMKEQNSSTIYVLNTIEEVDKQMNSE